jgi:hypothetical protein
MPITPDAIAPDVYNFGYYLSFTYDNGVDSLISVDVQFGNPASGMPILQGDKFLQKLVDIIDNDPELTFGWAQRNSTVQAICTPTP